MSTQIDIPDTLFQRLQSHAEPLVDTPTTVIRRALDCYESQSERETEEETESASGGSDHVFLEDPSDRAPRQRGATIELNGTRVEAASVRDMYEKTMEYLDERGLLDQLQGRLPISTSRQRHLLNNEPVHPDGSEFVSPAEHDDYYMEAHKDYRNGLNHLCQLLDHCDVQLTYRG